MLKSKDVTLLLLITLLAVALRLPYWQTIPAAGDEVAQGTYAIQIARGEKLPLVANDQYDGPFFVYLLAVLFRLGIKEPLLGRVVILTTGSLIAPLTYLLVRRLKGSPLAGLIAAALVVTNPHLILMNSHIGGTTQLLPFFTTLFLWLVASAVETDQVGWLIAAAIAGGLALQANLAAVLLVAGVYLWLALRLRPSTRLGRRWPLWPLAMGLVMAAVYSPVIVFNLLTIRLGTVATLRQRTYLWQANPTLATFAVNLWRLAAQLTRQMSGVLVGDETWRTILGLPLLYAAWAVSGLVVITRRLSRLPLASFPLFVILVPYFSSHFGMFDPVRFTTPFTPVLAGGMGCVTVWALERLQKLAPARRRWLTAGLLVAVALLAAFPTLPLFQYYAYINDNHLSGDPLLELSRQMVAANRGEPVYISPSAAFLYTAGIPYVPELHLIMAGIQHALLPPDQIIGRLFALPGPATLLLDDEDAAAIQRTAALIPWPGAANQAAHRQGFGLYTLDLSTPLVKPDFVLTGAQRANLRPLVTVNLAVGDGLRLIGYDVPDHLAPGQTLNLAFYWQRTGPMPDATYMGYAHLFDAQTMQLLAQDDHLLGHDQYPVNAWQPDEVVVDRFALSLPAGSAAASVRVQAGAYTWPDTVRLTVAGNPDNQIELRSVSVQP
jgi:hypothetical protein